MAGKREVLRRIRELLLQAGWGGTVKYIAQALLRRCGYWRSLPVEQRAYLHWIGFFERRPWCLRIRGNRSSGSTPVFSLMLTLSDAPQAWLEHTLNSVLGQSYTAWELLVETEVATKPDLLKAVERYAERDARVSVGPSPGNGVLPRAKGRYVAWLDQGDELAPDALHWIAGELAAYPSSALIYSDEDWLAPDGIRCAPYFKPDWNPDLFLAQNYVKRLGVFDLARVRSVGAFRSGFEGAEEYDLALRFVENLAPGRIRHIPRILYHRRAPSAAQRGVAVAEALAVKQHLERLGVDATVMRDKASPAALHVRHPLPAPLPLVTLIVLTRDRVELLRQCVLSILRKTTYPNYRILVVDNASVEAETAAFLADIACRENIAVLRDAGAFNFAALNNRAVDSVASGLVGLLNNDLEAINPDWLDEMVSHALRPEIGVVGARLWYPDDTLQHGGVFLAGDRVAMHLHKGLPRGQVGHGARAVATQNVAAVTGACMLMRLDLYRQVGGMDENLAVAYNDVDLCLRVGQLGLRNVWTPHAELYHHESASRGAEDTPEKQARLQRESDYMKARWGRLLYVDPAYNPNLAIDREDAALAWPPRLRQNARRPKLL